MTTMSMDLDRILITFYAAILALLLASGIVHGQWDSEEDDQVSPMERRQWGITGHDPEYDWRNQETFNDNEKLFNLLKRGGSYVSDSYKRHPRIKQIIPFYSYGSGMGGYRSRVPYGRRRKYVYRPWSRNSYYYGRRVQTPIYAGY